MRNNAGFTLIEILIATMILATGLFSLMVSLGQCAQMMSASQEFQDAQYVFALGELKYPLLETNKVEEDIPVDPDSTLVEGYTFERTVDEKELETNVEDDNLYIVRTRVSWGTGENDYEELVRYVLQTKSKNKP